MSITEDSQAVEGPLPILVRRASTRCSILEKLHDLARVGVAPDLRFLEYRNAVGDDLESAAARLDQIDLRVGEAVANLGRQTDGPGFVASHRAVFNRDRHGR